MTAKYLREVPLQDVLRLDCVLDNMTNRTKKGVIEDLIAALAKQKLIANKTEACSRILEREDLVTTAMGHGVAIPHARMAVGDKPVIAIGRHKTGVDFDSPDNEPVNLIFLVLWEPEMAGLFNRLFAGLVSKLADQKFREKLLTASSAEEIIKSFSDVKIDMQAGRAAKCEADMLVTLQLLETKRKGGTRGLERQIELARQELPGSILTRFDRLISRMGEALVDAPEGICNGCNMQLSSSFASEMLINPDTIYVCEKCGRFLVHKIA